ncbi:sulfotransferase ssu-1-like [Haemaphysalis longicornis]
MAHPSADRRPLRLRQLDGVYLSSFFQDDKFRSAQSYKPRPDDVFVVGYPKSGTTWLQFMMCCILKKGQPPKKLEDLFQQSPFLEVVGGELVEAAPRPVIIKSHLHFDKMVFSEEVKYVCVVRNPYDCCVSFYHHTKNFPMYGFEEGTFEEFFDLFVQGQVDLGDYFAHLMSWYEQRWRPNILYITYEDVKSEPVSWILKITEFINPQLAAHFLEYPDGLEKVVNCCSVDAMKEMNAEFRRFTMVDLAACLDDSKNTSCDATRKPMSGDFVRKGIVGDWKNHFNSDQIERMKAKIASVPNASSVVAELWKGIDLP